MATLGQARTYGGIGSILALLAPMPFFGWALAIAGFILMLVAVKYISDIIRDPTIMNNMIISIAATVVGIVVGAFVILGSVFRFIGLNNLVGPAYFGTNFNPASISAGDWIGLVASVLVGVAVTWAFLTVSGILLRRSYSKIGAALDVNMFGTAGLVFLVGAATTIVLVGFILIPVALILLAIAFFSIKDTGTGTLQAGSIPVQSR